MTSTDSAPRHKHISRLSVRAVIGATLLAVWSIVVHVTVDWKTFRACVRHVVLSSRHSIHQA